MSFKKILIVEDEAKIAKNLKETIEEIINSSTVIVCSGEKAIKLAETKKPDLVMMNIHLHDKMEGIESANEIYTRFNIPVIFLSALPDDKLMERAKKVGSFGYILTPFSERELKTNIEMTLYRAEMDRNLIVSEERYRNIVELSPDGIMTMTLTGKIISVNKAFVDLTGFTKKEFENKHFLNTPTLIPQNLSMYKKLFTEVLAGKIDKNIEFKWKHKSGEIRDGEVHLKIIRNKANKKIIQTIVIDTTERIRTQKKLKDGEERFRSIVETAPGLLIISDKNGKTEYVSPSSLQITGYSQKELMENFIWWIHDDDLGKVKKAFAESYRKKEGLKNFQFKGIKKNGEIWYGSESWEALYNSDKQFNGFVMQTIDITEQKMAENALGLNEQRFRLSLGNSKTMVFHQDHNLRYTWVYNPINNLTVENIIGKKDNELFFTEDADLLLEKKQHVLKFGNIEQTVINYSINGKSMFFDITIEPLFNANKKIVGITGTLTDITHLKEVEKELLESEEKFENIIERIYDLILSINLEGNIIYVSSSVMRLFGYNPEELIDKNITEFVPEVEISHIKKTISLIKAGKNVDDHYSGFLRKNGSSANITLSVVPIIKNNIIVGGQAIIRDDTQRKITEEALQLTQFSVDNSTDAVYWMGSDAKLTYVNNAAIKALGYSREELLTMTVHEIGPDFPAEVWADHWADLKKRKSFIIHTLHQRKDKSTFPVEITVNFIQYGDKEINCAIAKDITERKLVDIKLQESEKKFRTMFERASDAISIVEKSTGYYLDANKATERLTGRTLSELKKLTVHEVTPKGATKRLKILTGEVNAKNMGEVIYIRPNGSKRIALLSVVPLGENTMYGIAHDITERKKVEESLKESEKRFSMLIQQSPSVIELYTLDGLQISVNKAYEKLWGFPASRTVNKFNVLKSKEVKKSGLFEFIKRAYNGESVIVPEYKFDSRGKTEAQGAGRYRWLSTKIYPLKYLSGKVNNIVITHEDITERKLVEEALIESKNKFKNLFNNSTDGIFIHDLKGKFLEVNDVCYEQLGYTKEEFLNLSIEDISLKEDRKTLLKRKLSLIKNGKLLFSTFQITKQGKKLPSEISIRMIEYDNKQAILGIARDISDRITSEKKLQEKNDFIQTVLDNLPIGVALNNFDSGEATYMNKKYEDIFGWQLKDINNMSTFFQKVYPDKKYRQNIINLMTSDIQSGITDKMHWENISITQKSGANKTVDIVNIPLNEQNTIVSTVIDVTEQEKAKVALKESEEKYRTIIESTTDIVFLIDKKGKMLFFNEQFYKLLGYKSKNNIGKSFFEFVPKSEFTQYFTKFKEILLKKELYNFESFIYDSNKNIIPVEISGSTVVKNKEELILGSLRIITERKKAIQDLKESEKNYKQLSYELESILDHIPGFVFYKDKKNNYLRVNKYFAEAHKVTKDKLINKSAFDLYSKEEAEAFFVDDLKIIQSDREKLNYTESIETDKGQKWISTSKIPYKDKEGKTTGIIGISFDITKQKETEDERNKLFTAIDQSPTTIVITDALGNIEYVNPQFSKLTGYSYAEAINQNPRILQSGKTPPETFVDLWNTISNKKTWNGIFVNVNKNGEEFTEQAVITPVIDISGEIVNYIAIKQDISEQKRTEKNLYNKSRALSILSDVNFTISKHSNELTLLSEIANIIVYEGGYTFVKLYSLKEKSKSVYTTLLKKGIECNCLSLNKVDLKNKNCKESPLYKCAKNSKIYAKNTAESDFKIWSKQESDPQYSNSIILPIKLESKTIAIIGICPTSTAYFVDSEIELFSQLVNNISFGIKSIRVNLEKENKQNLLIESEKEFRHLFNSAASSILIQDVDTKKFLEVNDMAVKTYKYSREEFVKLKPKDLLIKEEIESYKKRLGSIISKGSLSFRTTHIKSNGDKFPVELTNKLIQYKNKNVIISYVKDITEQEKIQKQVFIASIDAEEKERSRIARDLHDGISPILSTIKLYTQALRDSKDEIIKEKIHEKTEYSIEQAIQSLSEISNNISPHILHNFGLKSAIENFIKNIESVTLKITFTSNLIERLHANLETILYRVVTELIHNGLKHSKASIMSISLVHNKNLELIYKDNGIGFDYKKKMGLKKGMGLFNIKNRIELLKGKVSFENKNGTLIKISIPIE